MNTNLAGERRNIFLQQNKFGLQSALDRLIPAWLANALLIGGAALISVAPVFTMGPGVFCGFLIGHVCVALRAKLRGDVNNLLLNGSMSLLDLYAILIRL